jgi:hypothetical protein
VKLDPDSVPKTVEGAVDALIASLSEPEREAVEVSSGAEFHFGAGMHVRNSWSLWEPDSPLKRDAVERFSIAHADDISGLIWAWAAAKLRGQPFDPAQECEIFHEHWRRYGMTSLQAGEWPPKKEQP